MKTRKSLQPKNISYKVDTAQIQNTSLNVIKKILMLSAKRIEFSFVHIQENKNSLQIDFLNLEENVKLTKRTFITEMLEQIAFTIDNDISNVEVKLLSKNETGYSLLSRFIRYFNTEKTIKIKYPNMDNSNISIRLKDLNMFLHF